VAWCVLLGAGPRYYPCAEIIHVAKWYLQKKGYLDREIRFDVLAIRFHGTGKPIIEHIAWAFDIEE